MSTLYNGGTVVQDFQAGSAARRDSPNRYETPIPAVIGSSHGAVAATASRGRVVQDFRDGSAAKHTVADHRSLAHVTSSPAPPVSSKGASLIPMDAAYPGNKHFQLEELEDAEACTTDVFLNTDNTITIGETNGPLFLSGSGTWSSSIEEDDKTFFEMIMRRRYQTGKEGTQTTDIGEFEYDVERTFRGELTVVGGTALAVNGEILDVDETFGDRRVSTLEFLPISIHLDCAISQSQSYGNVNHSVI